VRSKASAPRETGDSVSVETERLAIRKQLSGRDSAQKCRIPFDAFDSLRSLRASFQFAEIDRFLFDKIVPIHSLVARK